MSYPGKPSDAGQIGGNGYEETCSIPEMIGKVYLELPECSLLVVGCVARVQPDVVVYTPASAIKYEILGREG